MRECDICRTPTDSDDIHVIRFNGERLICTACFRAIANVIRTRRNAGADTVTKRD